MRAVLGKRVPMRRSILASWLILSSTLLLAAGSSIGAANRQPARAVHVVAAPRADVSDFEVGADSNATWPAGWRRGGNQPTARVELVTPGHGGERAVKLSASGLKGYVALVRALPDSLRAGAVAVRLTAWIRTEGAGRVSMWVHLITSSNTIASNDSAGRWPEGDTGWTRYEVLMPVLPEVQRVTYGIVVPGGGTTWVDDVVLEALEPEQAPQSSPRARAYLDAALDSLCRRSVLTSQLSWGVLQRAARTQMLGGKVPADAGDALRYAVRRLDSEGEFVPPAVPRLVGLEQNFRLMNVLSPDSTIGMIRMPSCTSESRAIEIAFADTTRSVITRLGAKGIRGWLVDLRVVTGGEIAPAMAGLGPLMGEGTLLGWQRPDGRRGRWTHHHGLVEYEPGAPPECRLVSVVSPELHVDSLPVAVLVGPRTSGAGEALALAFRGRANTRFFGEPTAGHGQARERIRLSDGAELRFATGILSDRNGRRLEGAFMPDDSLNAGLLTGGMDSLMTQALRWLGRAPAGKR